MKPPLWLERLVGIAIPSACRVEVLGDLYERCASPGQYVMDALGAVPLIVMSRIRRTTDAQVLLMQAFAVYLSFLAAARYLDPELLAERWGLVRLAVPVGFVLLGVILGDAYAGPVRR